MYLLENTHDNRYPFIIKDGWGGECSMSVEELKKLQEEITKALDKRANVCYNNNTSKREERN